MEMCIVTRWDHIVLKSEVALLAWHYQYRHVLKCKTGMGKLLRGNSMVKSKFHPDPQGASGGFDFHFCPSNDEIPLSIIWYAHHARNNCRSPDIIRLKQSVKEYQVNFALRSDTKAEHLTSSSWVIFFKVLSVSKLRPVLFVKCRTKRNIWKDICPVNKEKSFPALN